MIKHILNNITMTELDSNKKTILSDYAINIDSNNCPVIFDLRQLFLILGLSDDENIQIFSGEYSNRYCINKKNGSLREVWQPSYQVKVIQKWILKSILNKVPVSDCAHGFVKNKSILTNAQIHIHENKFWIFSVDIKNFFPSIKINKVEKVFLDIGYSPSVSNALSLLCTIDGRLVQGFPTSPTLSNLIFKEIDIEFQMIAERYQMKYSRYADDISFSGNQTKGYTVLVKRVEKIISFILEKHGFKINYRKTRLLTNNQSRIVTGLMVSSDGVRIPRKYIKKLSRELYYCEKFGVNEHLKYHGIITIANYRGYLTGLARYIYMVEEEIGAKFIERINELDWY